jgi:hypothetical protein
MDLPNRPDPGASLNLARWCGAASALAIIAGPVAMLAGGFSASANMMCLALVIMGGLGLFAAMRAIARSRSAHGMHNQNG